MHYRFQRFEVLPHERRLRVDGQPVPVGARAFDLLLTLLERRDRVVSKHELLETVWPAIVVEENNLQVQISTLRKLLGQEAIATIPGRGYRFVLAVSTGEARTPAITAPEPVAAPAAGSAPVPKSNLPERAPALFGREAELVEIRALLDVHRVVSIVASSGVGKTRLAQAVAAAAGARFADGVWWVELAPLTDAELVAAEVASVVGFQLAAGRPGLQTVIDVLRTQSLLLLLDNCEHLLGSVATMVEAIVETAPQVRVLVTSLEPLKIGGEQVYRLNTLGVPSAPGLADAETSGAVQLFIERVRAVDPHFALTAANADKVSAVCQRLDGIPLALELAAARVPLLGLDGLHARLDERFRILTGSSRFVLRRHQTLRAALDFSHGLLTPEEKVVLRRLGLFAGSFSVESAQDVVSDEQMDGWAVLDNLGTLVDKSMVLAEGGERPRLRLLETARAYALEKLGDAGETDALLERHSRAMARVLAAAHDDFWLLPDAVRVARYAPEIDNLRAALSWALGHDPELAIELCGNAGLLWINLELQPEGARLCEAALAGVGATTPALSHGRLWHALAWMLTWSQPGRAREAAVRASELLREAGDSVTLAMALLLTIPRNQTPGPRELAAYAEIERLYDPAAPAAVRAIRFSAEGRVHRSAERYAEALRCYVEGESLLAGAGATHFELTLQWQAGELAVITGDLVTAVAVLSENARRRAAQRSGLYLVLALGSLTRALLFRSQTAAARERLAQVAPLIARYDLGPRYAATAALLAAQERRWSAAAELLGYGEAALHGAESGERTEAMARERAELLLSTNAKPDEVAAWRRAGASLTTEAAYWLALDQRSLTPTEPN